MNSWDDDDPLIEEWRLQAKQAWIELLATWTVIDQIISSNLNRAIETARMISQEIGYEWVLLQDTRLREQDWGNFKWRRTDTLRKFFKTDDNKVLRKIFKDRDYNHAEWVEQFDSRVTEAFRDIQENFKDKVVLIVWHSGTSRPLLRVTQNLDFDFAHYEMSSLPNAKIIDLETFEIEWKKLKS